MSILVAPKRQPIPKLPLAVASSFDSTRKAICLALARINDCCVLLVISLVELVDRLSPGKFLVLTTTFTEQLFWFSIN